MSELRDKINGSMSAHTPHNIELFRAGVEQLKHSGMVVREALVTAIVLRVVAANADQGFRVEYSSGVDGTNVSIYATAAVTLDDPPIRCSLSWQAHVDLYAAVRATLGVAVARANALWANAFGLPPDIHSVTSRAALAQGHLLPAETTSVVPTAEPGTARYDIEIDVIETMTGDGWEICYAGNMFHCVKTRTLIEGDPFSGFTRATMALSVCDSPHELRPQSLSLMFVDPEGVCSSLDGYVTSMYGDLWQCLALVNATIRGAHTDMLRKHHPGVVDTQAQRHVRALLDAAVEVLDTCVGARIVTVSWGDMPCLSFSLCGENRRTYTAHYEYGRGWHTGNYGSRIEIEDLVAWIEELIKNHHGG